MPNLVVSALEHVTEKELRHWISWLMEVQSYLGENCVWFDQEQTRKAKVIEEMEQECARYRAEISCTSGCGGRVQQILDRRWNTMNEIMHKHPDVPELKMMLPDRFVQSDDGAHGAIAGLGMGLQSLI